jgi:valyl-tRNA synthetase
VVLSDLKQNLTGYATKQPTSAACSGRAARKERSAMTCEICKLRAAAFTSGFPTMSTPDTASRDAENTGTENNVMATAFDPHPVEDKWSQFWRDENLFAPRESATGDRFCITIPPPNITGSLHLGHALQHSIHDCLLRYHRMKGDATLCVPGTDHASIATEVKVLELIRETEGKNRHEIGREEFLRRARDWKEKYGGTIINQLKALGCSYDWSRERFTLDREYSQAVLTVFKTWFDAGLIYRGLRLVNWSPGAQSTVSDLEIEHRETDGSLWHFRYPIENSDEHIIVATTRPETMLGDSGVAVHSQDARYAHLVGKNVLLPLTNRKIPIVADDYVDASFGSGAVKVTPAHDPNDYEIGERHGLEKISVIGFDAKMTQAAGREYSGLSREEARKKVVADLQALKLVEKIEPHVHSVGHCSRTGSVIEPLLSEQWFVDMQRLATPVADALKMNRVNYIPDRFAGTSLEWLENIRDWCISRQLWWGHRIPIWYGPNGEVVCSIEPIEDDGWHQDEDVLDTWFSSALWPFAVLGWPQDFQKQWYPTSVLITGRDILNLWVSRMILTSLYFVEDEIPFRDVFVHPTVQDVFGLRMSKSLGTGIDPMALIETYGADATRFGLLQLATGSQDVRFIDNAEANFGEANVRKWMRENRGKPLPLEWSEKPGERYPQMQSARNFANKIWNAARFVLSQEAENEKQETGNDDLPAHWILSRLYATEKEVSLALENYQFDTATSALYSFIWNDFCDWLLEISKPKLRAGDASTLALLNHVLEIAMRLLHPFMPFLSEEIWQRLPKNSSAESLSVAAWPCLPQEYSRPQAEREFALLQDVVRATRNLRAEANLSPGKKPDITLFALNAATLGVLQNNSAHIAHLANLQNVTIENQNAARPQNALSSALSDVEIFLPLAGLIDIEKESARLQKEIEIKEKDLARVAGKLSNTQFTDKAPREVVAKEEAKRDELLSALKKLRERLDSLKQN